MTREEIKNKVTAIVADKIGFSVSEIKEDTSFKYDLGTDSLDEVEIVMELEREFGITIKDEELVSVGTVGEVIDVICKKFDVPICKQQPDVEFEKEYRAYMKSRKDGLSGNVVTVNMKDMAHHFYEFGLKGRREEQLWMK